MIKVVVVIYDGQKYRKTAFSWKLTVGMPRYALIGGTRGYNQFRRVHEQIADYEYVELDVNDSVELEKALKDTRYSGYNIANPFNCLTGGSEDSTPKWLHSDTWSKAMLRIGNA